MAGLAVSSPFFCQHTTLINRWPRRDGASMAGKNRVPLSPSPQRPSGSPSLSAIRPSPLTNGSLRSYPVAPSSTNGSLRSYPVTSSPFSSSPTFSYSHARSSPSPDLFDDFTYSEDMDDDLHRMDSTASAILEAADGQVDDTVPLQNDGGHVPNPTPPQEQKMWVVFRGRAPGIYEH